MNTLIGLIAKQCMSMNALIVKSHSRFMGIHTVSIVAMSVISQTDSEVEVMSNEKARNERLYQTTMAQVKQLLKQGIISPEEYGHIDTIFREKYRPSLGSLLFDIDLIQME